MSRWTRVKAAMLTATVVVAAFQFGGCLGGLNYNKIVQLVTIANIFD